MTYLGPDPGIAKQWETKVARWVSQGRTREEILGWMTMANWNFGQAEQMVRKVAGRERRRWIILMSVCAALAVLGLAITVFSMTNPQGGVYYFPIGASVGFIFGLVRLVKIRA